MNPYTSTSPHRLHAIDCLRGLVMVLMTLDHTRDFFSNAHFSPTDLTQTTPALFFTRWITHFCAPIFVFLAGSSAYLWAARRGPQAPISRFLILRGCLILILTYAVEAWAWDFRHDFRQINGGVLWAIAWSMIALAGLVKLRFFLLVLLGGLLVGVHNALDGLKSSELGSFAPLWAVLHSGESVQLNADWQLKPYYPLLPWIGVMALGYGFGKFLSIAQLRTPKRLSMLGLSIVAGFLLLRFSNLYGDPHPWLIYPDPVFTGLSFINCHKYPPSLLYLLMTLGPALLLLAFFEGRVKQSYAVLQVFGRTPLFFYLLHLYLIHLLAVFVAFINHGPVLALLEGGIWSSKLPVDYGYSLPVVYLVSLLILCLLYPVCRWFEDLKLNKPHWRFLSFL